MYVAIPLDDNNMASAKITKVFTASSWAVVELVDGVMQKVNFYDTREDIAEDFVDFVVLENKFENYMEFMDEGSMVLVVREEKSIGDIMEAFRFKELDEVGF